MSPLPQPNPMMEALKQSRQDNPVSSSGPMPGGAPQPQQPQQSPDMAKYWSMMQDMSSKLDKLIDFIGGSNTGKNPDAPDVEGKDENDGKENHKHGSSGY